MKKQSNKTIVIKLSQDEIPYLNATLYLGSILEDWCSAAIACGVGIKVSNAAEWRKTTSIMRMKIYDQTEIEYHKFGASITPNTSALFELLKGQVSNLRDTYLLQERERMQKKKENLA